MIKFEECPDVGYSIRTYYNAKIADCTLAFAVDFNTTGEICTRKAAYGKYFGITITPDLTIADEVWNDLINWIFDRRIDKINIAGNGIYTLPFTQAEIDTYILTFMQGLREIFTPFKWRSGGQTGIDEAGLKAADKLGFETTCLAPKGWAFRDATGKDIYNKQKFLARFGDYDLL